MCVHAFMRQACEIKRNALLIKTRVREKAHTLNTVCIVLNILYINTKNNIEIQIKKNENQNMDMDKRKQRIHPYIQTLSSNLST